MKVVVYGLWHLGCVTATCMAEAGFDVVGLDVDPGVVADLRRGQPPLFEPGLAELLKEQLTPGRLTVTDDPASALTGAACVWVTFDTPVSDDDVADIDFLRERLDWLEPHVAPGSLVLISSQVPVGFTAELEKRWQAKNVRCAYSPENLRLGQALNAFRQPQRIVVGARSAADREVLQAILSPFCANLVWMTVESAEMTKHALNAFLATSVSFMNELARVCEVVGADAKQVEQGLKSDLRIGSRAYLSPGAAFAGGTLARDVRFLGQLGSEHNVATPLFEAVRVSNDLHKAWTREKIAQSLAGHAASEPVVAVLGLTYKPGTDTLRRSAAVALCEWLQEKRVVVRAHDPALTGVPEPLAALLTFCPTPEDALRGADLAVICTPWPEFRKLHASVFVQTMRRPCVIDLFHHLSGNLEAEPKIAYIAPGKPLPARHR